MRQSVGTVGSHQSLSLFKTINRGFQLKLKNRWIFSNVAIIVRKASPDSIFLLKSDLYVRDEGHINTLKDISKIHLDVLILYKAEFDQLEYAVKYLKKISKLQTFTNKSNLNFQNNSFYNFQFSCFSFTFNKMLFYLQ